MATTASDIIVQTLVNWGVDTIFGIPGDGTPMPAKIKATQAIHFAESMARGTKDWQKIAETIAKDRVRELV